MHACLINHVCTLTEAVVKAGALSGRSRLDVTVPRMAFACRERKRNLGHN